MKNHHSDEKKDMDKKPPLTGKQSLLKDNFSKNYNNIF